MSVSRLNQYTCAIDDKTWYYIPPLIFFILTALKVALYLCSEHSKVLYAFCYEISNMLLDLVMGAQAARNCHPQVGCLLMVN